MYRNQSSVPVNGPKVDIFIEQFLKSIEALIDTNVDSFTEKNQQIKGALSLSDSTSNKSSRTAIECNNPASTDHVDPFGNLSTNSKENAPIVLRMWMKVQCDKC